MKSTVSGGFTLYYFVLLLAGLLQGVMTSLNAMLNLHFSMFGMTFFVHAIALVLLGGYLLIRREKIDLKGAPPYVYLVGAMGIAIVALSGFLTLKIGAGASMALSTVGQLICSELIDIFGLFGMQKSMPNLKQLPGFLIVGAGVLIVVMS